MVNKGTGGKERDKQSLLLEKVLHYLSSTHSTLLFFLLFPLSLKVPLPDHLDYDVWQKQVDTEKKSKKIDHSVAKMKA